MNMHMMGVLIQSIQIFNAFYKSLSSCIIHIYNIYVYRALKKYMYNENHIYMNF